MSKLKTAVLLLLVMISTNIGFVLLNYVGDTVPTEFVKHRITTAFKRHNITTDEYPLFRFGLPSIYSTIGIDQITDCMTYLHALYQPDDPVRNALVPAYWDIRNRRDNNLCRVVKQISFNQVSPDQIVVTQKTRLWHGAKTILLLALPKLNFFQINMLIKQITYVGYGLLACLLLLGSRQAGAAFVPVALVGIFASGITVYGGVSNSLPYLMAIVTAVGLVMLSARQPRGHWIWAAIMGNVLAYLYELDGSLMLALGLILFCAYFRVYAGLQMKQRWSHTVVLLCVFMAGFVFSLVLKQLIAFPYLDPGQVWNTFVGAMSYRVSGDFDGQRIDPFVALGTQFKRYYFAVINWHQLADFLKFTGTWGWAVAAALALYQAIVARSLVPLSHWLAFALVAAIVLTRYLVMANHSQIHTIIVSRYLFVMFAFAWAATVWMAWDIVKGSDRRLPRV